jgi:hypothetical protein
LMEGQDFPHHRTQNIIDAASPNAITPGKSRLMAVRKRKVSGHGWSRKKVRSWMNLLLFSGLTATRNLVPPKSLRHRAHRRRHLEQQPQDAPKNAVPLSQRYSILRNFSRTYWFMWNSTAS